MDLWLDAGERIHAFLKRILVTHGFLVLRHGRGRHGQLGLFMAGAVPSERLERREAFAACPALVKIAAGATVFTTQAFCLKSGIGGTSPS